MIPKVLAALDSKVLEALDSKVLDIVVNNAFVADVSAWEPFENISLGGLSRPMNSNIFEMISIAQAAMTHFPSRGRVIKIFRAASKVGNDNPLMIYGASKAAADSITRSLAVTCAAKTEATFNSVSVGATSTDIMKSYVETAGHRAFNEFAADPMAEKRIGSPVDVAFVVRFLAREEGRLMTGANVAANGGFKESTALQCRRLWRRSGRWHIYQMPGIIVYLFLLYLSPNSFRYLRSFLFAH
jgi:3-oxoacyl-[acyl-carrier protein] reductase